MTAPQNMMVDVDPRLVTDPRVQTLPPESHSALLCYSLNVPQTLNPTSETLNYLAIDPLLFTLYPTPCTL